jgi:alpha-glucosidase
MLALDATLSLLPFLPQPQRPLRRPARTLPLVLRRIGHPHSDAHPLLSPPIHVHAFPPSPHHRLNRHARTRIGPSILVTPVLEPQVDSVNGIFPGIVDGEVWYDWYTGGKVEAEAGVNTSIPAPLGHIPVFIRGGSVLPTQEPGYTTTESRNNPWGLIVALSGDGEACGSLYVDDGESLEPSETLEIELSAKDGCLKAAISGEYVDTNPLGNVTIMGLFDGIGDVKLNDEAVDDDKVDYDEDGGVLRLTGLNDLTSGGAWKNDWTLSW